MVVDIVDSNLTFEEAIEGTSAPKEVIDSLVLINLVYHSFDGKVHQGQMMVHKKTKKSVENIFVKFFEEGFPINKAVPMSVYGWDDDLSMEDNNSSGFCYRKIAGSENLSNHSFGYAIDINPKNNPLITKSGKNIPETGSYDISRAGTLVEGSVVVNYIISQGYDWGMYFSRYKDIQHFDFKDRN